MLGGGGGGVPGGHSSVPIDKEVKMVAANKGNNSLLMTILTIMIVTISESSSGKDGGREGQQDLVDDQLEDHRLGMSPCTTLASPQG